MHFTIHGVIDDRSVSITWNKGFVSGDRSALNELFALSSVLEGKRVGPEPDGPFTTEDHLSVAASAQVLMEDVLDEVTHVEGRLPTPLLYHALPEAA